MQMSNSSDNTKCRDGGEFEYDHLAFSQLQYVARNIKKVIKESETVDINKIREKIYVDRPYFAFNKIYKYRDILIAPITSQQPTYFESTPISSAEASRHLAILGSCSLSVDETKAQYYMANKARKRASCSIRKISYANQPKLLYVLAKKYCSGKREASAVTSLIEASGIEIFNFQVNYLKLSEQLFEKIFSTHFQTTKKHPLNPYYETLNFQDIKINGSVLHGTLPVINPIYCAGHFERAPILPVGILAYMAINSLGYFLDHITNDPALKYHLKSADMDVFSPTDIKETADLKVRHVGTQNNEYRFVWEMQNRNDKKLNSMDIVFVKHYQLINV